MTDYSELVKALRCLHVGDDECGGSDCPYWSGLGCRDGILCDDAAAAIEELEAEVEKWTFNATLEQSKAIANFESYCKLKAQLPKRGKWTEIEDYDGDFHYQCSVCGEEWYFINGTPADNNANYCPRCGAKMEVQDAEM